MSGQRDVNGTLVTQDKVLTEAAKAAARALHDARIVFAITSGRSPPARRYIALLRQIPNILAVDDAVTWSTHESWDSFLDFLVFRNASIAVLNVANVACRCIRPP